MRCTHLILQYHSYSYRCTRSAKMGMNVCWQHVPKKPKEQCSELLGMVERLHDFITNLESQAFCTGCEENIEAGDPHGDGCIMEAAREVIAKAEAQAKKGEQS